MINWDKHCILSIVHFMAFPDTQSGEGPFINSIRQIADLNFFGALEMGPINDRSIRIETGNLLDKLGLKAAYCAHPLILGQSLDLNSFEEPIRDQAVSVMNDALQQAVDINADRFVLLSGKDPGEQQRSQAYDMLEKSLLEISSEARKLGIRLVLETFDRGIDKCALVGPTEEAVAFAERMRVNDPDFGLLYDMGHMPLLDETPDVALNLIKNVLVGIHLGNCVKTPGWPCSGDKHPRFGFPGGENDTGELVAFLKQLFNTGYLKEEPDEAALPWVGFEVKPQEGETTEQILENIQKTWIEAWDQL